MIIQANEVEDFYYTYSQVTLILRLRSVTSLTLAKANQFNNKLWNTCGNGAIRYVNTLLQFTKVSLETGTGQHGKEDGQSPPSSEVAPLTK